MLEQYKRFASGPTGMLAAAIGIMSGTIIGWKWGIKPILRRRKREEAEEFAEFIFQERVKKREENLQQ